MMKLTVAFLAALAAADAAEARSNRQARRAYGYGGSSSGYPSYPENPVVSSYAVETPASSAVPYVQSSADVFETSSSPADTSYPSSTPSPVAGGNYGEGYGTNPPVDEEKPEVPSGGEGYGAYPPVDEEKPEVPSGGEGEPTPAVPYVPIESSDKTADSSAYGSGFAESTPAEAVKPTPSGVYPTGGAGVPSGAYPSGGYGQPESSPAVPKDATSTPAGYPAYPTGATGTGSYPASSTPLSDYVTKTVYSTQIFTKTACPSTVTDCPAKSTSLVTSVIAVGTTVCPESEYPEATPVKVSTSKYPVSEVTNKVTETLVYTVGVGSSAHPVTTEVVSTSTSTVYSTVVVTVKPTPSVPSGGEGYPVDSESEGEYPEGGKKPTGTSTIKSTTTSTKYITVKPTPSANVPVGSEGYPTGPAGGKGEDCAAPVTVTVTAKETVTVTKGADKPAETPSNGEKPSGDKPSKEKPTGETGKPTTPEDYPEYPATPTGKYPVGNNGTNPYPAGPTGFKTSTKPAYPTGTGYVPTKPETSETSSLPYFSFVSEVPYPTKPVETPSVETEVPYPSAPAGGDYGSGYGEVPAVPSKTPSEEETYPTPTPAGNGYGSGYGTY